MSTICLIGRPNDTRLHSRLIIDSLMQELKNKRFPMEILDYSDILCDYDHLTKLFDRKTDFVCYWSVSENTGFTDLNEKDYLYPDFAFNVSYDAYKLLITINFRKE